MPAVEEEGKAIVHLQSTATAVLTWWVGPIGDEDTVCETGETYGPYTVTLDADGRPVSVDTEWVELTQQSREWYNAGQFSMCIQIEATRAGTDEHRKSSHGPDTRKALIAGSLESIFVLHTARGEVAPQPGVVA